MTILKSSTNVWKTEMLAKIWNFLKIADRWLISIKILYAEDVIKTHISKMLPCSFLITSSLNNTSINNKGNNFEKLIVFLFAKDLHISIGFVF